MHKDLLAAKALAYDPNAYAITAFRTEAESAEYGACVFRLNQAAICFRVAKITPLKVGQFVTLWKRSAAGPIEPFDVSDDFDFYIVSTRSAAGFGQFIFPKSVLRERDVLSQGGAGGKRAMRVYPPWDVTTSKQAQQTQRWQLPYFLELRADAPMGHALKAHLP